MLSNVSHEFRTPLNSMITQLDFALLQIKHLKSKDMFPERTDLFDLLEKQIVHS